MSTVILGVVSFVLLFGVGMAMSAAGFPFVATMLVAAVGVGALIGLVGGSL